jgi:hypothetical protein
VVRGCHTSSTAYCSFLYHPPSSVVLPLRLDHWYSVCYLELVHTWGWLCLSSAFKRTVVFVKYSNCLIVP